MKTEGLRALTKGRLRVLVSASAMAISISSGSAIAQTVYQPPVRSFTDANGVDLIDGSVNIDYANLNIGGADNGISYYRWMKGFASGDSITGYMRLSGTVMTVSIGKVSDTFSVSGTTYTPTEANGSSLSYNSTTKIYTYTASDGSLAHFDKARVSDSSPYGEGLITDLVTPSGEILTYEYGTLQYCKSYKSGETGDICLVAGKIYRLGSVTNAYGYRISPTYGPFDWIYDPTNPSDMPNISQYTTVIGARAFNLAASNTTPQASLSYSTSGSGGTYYTVVTDNINQQTTFRNATTAYGIKRPGSTSEEVVYTRTGATPNVVTAVTTPVGTTNYARSDSGNARTVTVTDPLNHATVYVFDIPSRRLSSVTSPLGKTVSYQYDGSGRMTRVTQPEGNYVQYTYDARGNVTATRNVAKSGSGLADVTTTAGFDASCTVTAKCNQSNWTKDALGNQTDYTYDPTHGGVLTITQPAAASGGVRPQTRYSYTAMQAYYNKTGSGVVASGQTIYRLTGTSTCLSSASCAGAAEEAKTTVGYGPQTAGTGNNLLPVSVTQASGSGSISAATAMAYDAMGNLISIDGPLSGSGDTTVYLYDGLRRRIGAMGPDPDGSGSRKNGASRITYDPQGRITLAEQGHTAGQTAAAWSSFTAAASVATTYDTADHKLTETLKSGSTAYGLTQYSYDGNGRLDCSAVRMNTAIYGSLPASACSLSTTGSQGEDRIAKYTYDDANRATLVQTAYGTAQQANEVGSAYTDNGQISYNVDANNNRTTYEYDGHDRLVKTRHPVATKGSNSSSTTDYEQLTYGDNVHLTQRRLRDGATIAMSYDNLDRLTGFSGATVPARTFSYNLLGMQTGATFTSGGQSVTNAFDAFGRVTSQTTPQGAVSYQYDAASRRTRITWPDTFFVTYVYDDAGTVTAIRESSATSGVQVLASYSYDDLGRRTGVTYGNGTSRTYAYEAINRLAGLKIDPTGTANDLIIGAVGGTGTAITYNPASQITSLSRSNDAYAWTGHYNFDRNYTTNGLNQYTASGGTSIGYDGRGNLTSSGGTTYAYNGLNQLTSVSGGNSASMAYDPADRLYQLVSGSATTRYLYDGVNMIGEYDGLNALLRRFVPGPGTDEPIVWYEGSGTTSRRWLQGDERGSIVAVLDASGAAINLNRYDEYGIPQSTNTGRFQYTGQVWFAEAGLYYYKARFYSPTLGRFMQTDPIGYGDGLNWYNYVGGDPINATDPSGQLMTCTGSSIPRANCTGVPFLSGIPVNPDTAGGKAGAGSTAGGPISSSDQSGSNGGIITVRPSPVNYSTGATITILGAGNGGCGEALSSEITVCSARKTPGIGHNNPPSEIDIISLLRTPGIAIIGCILACKSSDVYPQILKGDLYRSSTLENSVAGKFDVRRVRGRDFNSDWTYLTSRADAITRNPNGTLTAEFNGFNVTRYISSSGGENTLVFGKFMNLTATKFRY